VYRSPHQRIDNEITDIRRDTACQDRVSRVGIVNDMHLSSLRGLVGAILLLGLFYGRYKVEILGISYTVIALLQCLCLARTLMELRSASSPLPSPDRSMLRRYTGVRLAKNLLLSLSTLALTFNAHSPDSSKWILPVEIVLVLYFVIIVYFIINTGDILIYTVSYYDIREVLP